MTIPELLRNVGDPALRRRARRLLEELNPASGMRILDAGCGDGFYLHLIVSLSPKSKLVGLDIDPRALEAARRNLAGREVSLVHGDVSALPFRASSFDRVICSEVLEHLKDDTACLREIYRVLRPGGIALFTVPHADYPFLWDPCNKTLEVLWRTHIEKGFFAGIWNQHLRLYRKEELALRIKQAGFRLEKLEAQTHYCLPFNHYLLNAAARLLYGRKLTPQLARAVSKFGQPQRRPLLVELAFRLVEWIDRPNERLPDGVTTVSLFATATKPRH